MTVRLEAYQTITYLPNPTFSDSENLAVSISRKFSMNGTRRTYVKSKDERRKLIMRFDFTRAKGLELHAFIRAYYSTEILLTDHNGVVWLGYFTSNPFDFETPARGEYQNIQIEFEGFIQ
ncbi:hypothetical protein LCGC14_0927150 [marine sediment metagenome]|uniref:Phage tail protein n=1 Tax=marine sediment metagenome TaxID=412755 RepID=A0A0F9RVP6_9ZZZZ